MRLLRDDKVDQIAKIPLFAQMSRRQLSQIAQSSNEMTINPGDVLTREGSSGNELIIIVSGKAHVERGGKKIGRMKAGDFFGEMSLIDGKPRSATVIADTPMTVLAVDGRSFRQMLQDIPALRLKVLVTLVERVRAAEKRLHD